MPELPEDLQTLQYDANRVHAVTIERDLPGVIITTGNVARMLRDDHQPITFDTMTNVERAVLVARLRSWADYLEAAPLRNLLDEEMDDAAFRAAVTRHLEGRRG